MQALGWLGSWFGGGAAERAGEHRAGDADAPQPPPAGGLAARGSGGKPRGGARAGGKPGGGAAAEPSGSAGAAAWRLMGGHAWRCDSRSVKGVDHKEECGLLRASVCQGARQACAPGAKHTKVL